MLQWSCGYGISRWIESIDSVKPDGDTLTARGRMRQMSYDESGVELHLDSDLIIRRAVRLQPNSVDLAI